MFSCGRASRDCIGTRTVRLPRDSAMKASCTGARTPPAVAMTSSTLSPRVDSGTRAPLVTSPVSVTVLLILLATLTKACGSIALPDRRSTMAASTCGGVSPTTWTRPA
jgi:hypothetical protein